MASQATEVRDFIESNWGTGPPLDDRLSKVPLDNMKEIVRFFDRDQVYGNEWTKAVVVRKINDTMDEDRTIAPTYIETIDKYVFTLYYRVIDVQEISYSEALEDVEEMGRELQRILKLMWDPNNQIGPYMNARYYWVKEDLTNGAQPDLRRTLYLSLSVVESDNDEVYSGFGSGLILDAGETIGDDPPAQDYSYTEVSQVNISEGFETIPYLTKDSSTNGYGVPYLSRGIFRGAFTMVTQAVRSDIEGSTTDKISQMYLMQLQSPLIGQHATLVLLHSNTNTENPVNTMTTKSFVKVTRVEKISSVTDLLQYRITGSLTKPSEYSFA